MSNFINILFWEQRKFSQFAFKQVKTSKDTNLPNVAFDDISSKNGKLNKPFSKLGKGKSGVLFEPSDVLFGKLRPYLDNRIIANFKGIAVGDFWVFKSKYSSNFLFSLIQTPRFHYISNISSGSKMPRSDWHLVSKYQFKIPLENEQRKIGKIFGILDNLISLQQRKNDLVKKIHKSIADGLVAKKLKYNHSTDKWKEYHLLDIAKVYQPKTISSNEFTEIGYPVFGANGFVGFYPKYNHVNSQVTISARGANAGNVSFVKGPAWITGNSMVINVDNKSINKMYLYTYLKTINIKKLITGGAQPQLTRENLSSLKIDLPSNKMQNYISCIMISLNLYVNNEKSLTEDTNRLKHFLLQKMFI